MLIICNAVATFVLIVLLAGLASHTLTELHRLKRRVGELEKPFDLACNDSTEV